MCGRARNDLVSQGPEGPLLELLERLAGVNSPVDFSRVLPIPAQRGLFVGEGR